MNISSESNFLQTTQQLAGVESINTTRLINLKSSLADISYHSMDKTWVIPKANRRSYLQQRIGVQSLKMWHTFKSVPQPIELILQDGTIIPILAGNWTEQTLANYLTGSLSDKQITVSYDPYQLMFTFCPSISISKEGSANVYLGLPSDANITTSQSSFPPILLRGPQCINIWTNFTMNNIPVSQYLSCVPIKESYGNYIFFTNFDNSESTLCLESDITNIRVILRDEHDRLLDYPPELLWELTLAVTSTVPEGFAPLEA